MFLWNMVGALLLMPALSCFLLADVRAPARYPETDAAAARLTRH
jgi:hypothetical protein